MLGRALKILAHWSRQFATSANRRYRQRRTLTSGMRPKINQTGESIFPIYAAWEIHPVMKIELSN